MLLVAQCLSVVLLLARCRIVGGGGEGGGGSSSSSCHIARSHFASLVVLIRRLRVHARLSPCCRRGLRLVE